MKKGRGLTVSVFGSSRAREGEPQYEEDRALGRMLAERGYRIRCGGYGGTMEAVSRGAREAGGEATGITVRAFDPLPANRWLGKELKAPDLFQRLQELIFPAHGYIVLRGGLGTLTELMLTWTLLQVRAIRGKPLILVGEHWTPVLETLSREMELGERELRHLRLVGSIAEAVEELEGALRRAASG